MGHSYNRKVFHVHIWAILHGAMVGACSFWPCCVKRIIAEFFCMLVHIQSQNYTWHDRSQNSIKPSKWLKHKRSLPPKRNWNTETLGLTIKWICKFKWRAFVDMHLWRGKCRKIIKNGSKKNKIIVVCIYIKKCILIDYWNIHLLVETH
jgi:hypothetical protein